MVNRYAPGPVPVAYSSNAVREELDGIASMLKVLADGEIDVSYAAPTRVKDGLIRLADGVDWNPGSGPGMYYFLNGAWHHMG